MTLGRTAPALRLYGVVATRSAGGVALLPPARLVGIGEVAGVVVETPPARRTPAPPDLDDYRTIVAAVFSQCAIVPAPPGVIFRHREALLSWLDLHHATLCDGVAHVEGRVEARVHVRAAATKSRDFISGRGDPKPVEIDAAAGDLFHTLGEDVPAWILTSRDPGDTPVDGAAVSTSSPSLTVVRPPTSYGNSKGSHDIVPIDGIAAKTSDLREASASFLVDRSRWRAFANAVAAAARHQTALDLELTGPWPPYDFVRLQFGG